MDPKIEKLLRYLRPSVTTMTGERIWCWGAGALTTTMVGMDPPLPSDDPPEAEPPVPLPVPVCGTDMLCPQWVQVVVAAPAAGETGAPQFEQWIKGEPPAQAYACP
jgi:hypothetical protein